MGRLGKMDDLIIKSNYLDESVTVKWYLPEGFTPMKDYRVCYMQDGDDYFRMGRIATLSDKLHSEMEIEPTIFVGIHYNDKFDRLKKYHPDGERQEAYITFLIREVLPQVEETLHITPVERALMGDSLAGTLAFMTASIYPSTFRKVIMQSPFVNETVMERANHFADYKGLEVHHSIGLEETDVSTTDGKVSDFLQPNRELMRKLKGNLQVYHYFEFDGNHTWKYWQQHLGEILTLMFGEE
ncbi:Enterochelin esterase [Gracilibacillus ureilyticus]|uniref:Enterochelin esterase n=1 Tax=Gracilibacillus ureilyticus TaxID=531814 RepID=A0A1H9VWX2_9BACI|nr:alpha/beta hydrolase-fold protein [Gracilibacillus ureilyticus]SES26122.1 Enterochelin esterase [Gracilibacillus ureilyticus]